MLNKLCCLSTDSCKGECIGLSRNQNIKFFYTLTFLALFVISQFINYSTQQLNSQDLQKYHCRNILNEYQSTCIAQKKTSLDMLALAILHFILFLFLLPKTNHVKVINEGLWLIKMIVLAGFVFLIDFTFGPYISEYVQFGSTLLSPVLYLLINIIIVDNIYFLDFKINNLSQKNKKIHILKVIFSILFWVFSIILNVFSYYQNQLWVSVSCSVLIAVFLILTFLRVSRNNSLFVYSLVMLHLNLISYSIHSQQDDKDIGNFRFIEYAYKIFILISLFQMLAEGGNQIRTKKSTINQILALNTSKKEEDNRYVSSNKWIMYHLIMVIIAFCSAAVFSYRYHSTNQAARIFLDMGRISWWATLVLVYFWSIVVQKIYPQQDFSELENYFKEFELN